MVSVGSRDVTYIYEQCEVGPLVAHACGKSHRAVLNVPESRDDPRLGRIQTGILLMSTPIDD